MDDVDIDTSALLSWISDRLDGSVVEATVLHDGLNLSLSLSTQAESDKYVLRRPNLFRESDSFIDLKKEFEVLERLQRTPVPAPEPIVLCEDESVIGDPFLVMSNLDGEAVPLGSSLPERFQRVSARERLSELLIDTLADLHTLDEEPFRDACEIRTLTEQITEALDRLEDATEETGHVPPAIWDVADWLRQNCPPESEPVLCHGDYRPANILIAGSDQPRISGVLDWETAFLGDPLTELGYLLLRWRDEGDPTPPVNEIATRYPDTDVRSMLTGDSTPGLAPFTSRPGSPSRQALVRRYEKRTGLSFEHEQFYRTLAAFVLTAVWEDIYRDQQRAGAPTDWEPNIDYMALLADSIASGSLKL